MKGSCRLIAGLMLATFVFAAPAADAQDSGSMQVGNATVSVGAGTALLTLPDVGSFVTIAGSLPYPIIRELKFSDDFDEEIGWNVNGSIKVPMGANSTVSLNGFWANIEDEHSDACPANQATDCVLFALVDDTTVLNTFTNTVIVIATNAKRDVDHWGGSLETKWQLNPGVMGVTRAPHRRYFALGADIRGIDQDLDAIITRSVLAPGTATYTEDLDTRYYGAYAALGGDYSIPFLADMTSGLGLQSSFLLRGGIYYADTDYNGRLIDNTANAGASVTSALSLSQDDVAFIGGLVLETKKRIGRRATLSLKSEYEYYSYVPEVAYNQQEIRPGAVFGAGGQVGTRLGSDNAFSARTSLRLTIKLGPDRIFQEPLN